MMMMLFECGAPLEELVPEHLSELPEVREVAEGLVMMMNDDDDDDGGGGSALMMMMMGEEVQKNYIYKLPIVRTSGCYVIIILLYYYMII